MSDEELEALSRAEDELIWRDAIDKTSKAELRAEIEQLRAEKASALKTQDLMADEIGRLQAEIKRIHARLSDALDLLNDDERLQNMLNVVKARRALEQKP